MPWGGGGGWQGGAKARGAGASFWSVQGGGDSGGKGGDSGAEEVEGFEEVKSKKKGRKIRSEDGSFAFDGVPDPVTPAPAPHPPSAHLPPGPPPGPRRTIPAPHAPHAQTPLLRGGPDAAGRLGDADGAATGGRGRRRRG